MILSIPITSFALLMLCAFVSGALGCAAVECILWLRRKKKRASSSPVRRRDASAWQKAARDEQLYNGR